MRIALPLVLLLLPLPAAAACDGDPFALLWAEKWRDGGSISVTVADSAGCAADFELDWRIGSATHGRMYLWDGPRADGARRLARPAEEARILDLLERVADRQPADREDPHRRYYGWLRELLAKAGRR